MSESWITPWRWHAAWVGWAAHSPAFTAVVAYERKLREPGRPPAAVDGAAGADRFAVAISGPWRNVTPVDQPESPGHTERYVLRGSLREVKDKLVAALERRQHAYNTRNQEVTDDA